MYILSTGCPQHIHRLSTGLVGLSTSYPQPQVIHSLFTGYPQPGTCDQNCGDSIAQPPRPPPDGPIERCSQSTWFLIVYVYYSTNVLKSQVVFLQQKSC